jgi:hypothetical protein
MGLLEAPAPSGEAAAATLVQALCPRRVAASAASSQSGADAPVGGLTRTYGAGVPPNPLMQPTNAGGAGRRPCPTLPVATKDRRFSQVVCS